MNLEELKTPDVYPKPRRKAPETIQEYKDEAIRLLGMANSPFAEAAGSAPSLMRMARRHVETAELLQRLEDLHR